jgi:hypothetical protein
MKKILFVLLSLTISHSAMAEWVPIGKGADSTSGDEQDITFSYI